MLLRELSEYHDTRHGNGAHTCFRNCTTDYRFRFEMITFQESRETKCHSIKIPHKNIARCQSTTGYNEFRWNATQKLKNGIDSQDSTITCHGSFCNKESSSIARQLSCILYAILMIDCLQV